MNEGEDGIEEKREEIKTNKKTYFEEQEEIKKSFKKIKTDEDNDDDDDLLLKLKNKSKEENVN